MQKLFETEKNVNLFKTAKGRARKTSLDVLFEKDMVDTKKAFLQMNLAGWNEFGKFAIKLNKDLKNTDNVPMMILSSALVIEGIIDIILIKIYDLDRYKKYSPYDFLSQINLRAKINIVKKLKSNYPRKKPLKKGTWIILGCRLKFIVP